MEDEGIKNFATIYPIILRSISIIAEKSNLNSTQEGLHRYWRIWRGFGNVFGIWSKSIPKISSPILWIPYVFGGENNSFSAIISIFNCLEEKLPFWPKKVIWSSPDKSQRRHQRCNKPTYVVINRTFEITTVLAQFLNCH